MFNSHKVFKHTQSLNGLFVNWFNLDTGCEQLTHFCYCQRGDSTRTKNSSDRFHSSAVCEVLLILISLFTLHTESSMLVDSSRNGGGYVVFISPCGSPSAVSTSWNTEASDSNQDERGKMHENKRCCLERRLPGSCQMLRLSGPLMFCKVQRAKHLKTRGECTGDDANKSFWTERGGGDHRVI